jgi:hypothetical protein
MDANRKITAALVSSQKDGSPTYIMFEAEGVSPDGAFFAGALLLEVNEAVTVELALPTGDRVRARARVTDVHRGATPGMQVCFIELSDDAKRKLSNGRND